MKLWAGRFQKETDTLVNNFNSSINFDARLYKQDIAGSIAHATMLGKQGIIEQAEAAGCKAIWGIGMLLWQGVAAFKLFTGKDMPAQEVLEKFFS